MGNIILCGLSWMMSSDYQFPVCNPKWLKNGKFRKAILSAFYTISQRNFGILLILWCSFKLWWNFCPDLSRSKFHSKGERYIVSILKVYYLNEKGVHDFETKEWLSANYCKGCCPQSPPPPPPTATALRSNKPKNIYRFTICFTLSM